MSLFTRDDLEKQQSDAQQHESAQLGDRAREAAMAGAFDGEMPTRAIASLAELDGCSLLLVPSTRVVGGTSSGFQAWGSLVGGRDVAAYASTTNPPVWGDGFPVFEDTPPGMLFIPPSDALGITSGDFTFVIVFQLNGSGDDVAYVDHVDGAFDVDSVSDQFWVTITTDAGTLQLQIPGSFAPLVGQVLTLEITREGDTWTARCGGLGIVSGTLAGTLIGESESLRLGWDGLAALGSKMVIGLVATFDATLSREQLRQMRGWILSTFTTARVAEW